MDTNKKKDNEEATPTEHTDKDPLPNPLPNPLPLSEDSENTQTGSKEHTDEDSRPNPLPLSEESENTQTGSNMSGDQNVSSGDIPADWGGARPKIKSPTTPGNEKQSTSSAKTNQGREKHSKRPAASAAKEAERIPLPQHWGFTPPKGAIAVQLRYSDDEFRHIRHLFYYGRPDYNFERFFEIINIYRVQNPTLFRRYALKRQALLTELEMDQLNEQELLHGTNVVNVEKICSVGFVPELSYASDRYLLGRGTYFTPSATLADIFATPSHPRITPGIIKNAWIPMPVHSEEASQDCDVDNSSTGTGGGGQTGSSVSKQAEGSAPEEVWRATLVPEESPPSSHEQPQVTPIFVSPQLRSSPSLGFSSNRFGMQPSLVPFRMKSMENVMVPGIYVPYMIPAGPSYVIVAKVLLGKVAKGNKFVEKGTLDCHSCVDNIKKPTIHVVFESNQIYPEYIIQYRQKILEAFF